MQDTSDGWSCSLYAGPPLPTPHKEGKQKTDINMYALRSSVAAAVLALMSAGTLEPPLELGPPPPQQQPVTLNWASYPVRAGASHSAQPVSTPRASCRRSGTVA